MTENVNSSLDTIEVADEDDYAPTQDSDSMSSDPSHPQHRVRIVTTKGRGGPMRDLLGKPISNQNYYNYQVPQQPMYGVVNQPVKYESSYGKAPELSPNPPVQLNTRSPGGGGGEHPVFRISLPPNSQQVNRLSAGSGTVRIVKISKPLANQAYKTGQPFVHHNSSQSADEDDEYIDSNELVEDIRSGGLLRKFSPRGQSPIKRARKRKEMEEGGRKKDDVLIILDGQPSAVQKKRGPGRKPKGQGDERELTEPLPPPRSYQQRKPANKEDLGEYIKWRERRDRNNDAVRRTRVKKKQRELEMEIRVDHLNRQKDKILNQLKDAYKEMRMMREILRDLKDGKQVEIPENLTEPIPDSVLEELLYLEPLPPMAPMSPTPSTDPHDEETSPESMPMMQAKMEPKQFNDPQLEEEQEEEEMVEQPIPGVDVEGVSPEADKNIVTSSSGRPVRETRRRGNKKFMEL